MLKKLLSCLLVLIMALAVVACENSSENSQSETSSESGGSSSISSLSANSGSNSGSEEGRSSSIENENANSSIEGSNSSSIEGSNSSSSEGSNSSSSEGSSSSSNKPIGSFTAQQQELLTKANNVIDWQLDNGGWGKNYDTTTTFNGFPSDYCWAVKGSFVGTIDNSATYTEMRLLAEAYDINPEQKYKDSFNKGLAFLKNLQYPSGGFSQIYPHNGKYNDYVTFNDGAMVAVLNLLQDIAQNKTPFKNIVDESERSTCQQMIDKAVDYILKAQITVKGEKAAWCAQHNPTTYAPEMARSYELPSVSGSESVGVIKFLLTQTNNQQALQAAESARLWLKARAMENTTYSKKNAPTFFSTKSGSYCWFRFYDLTNGEGYYCDRDGNVYTDIAKFYAAAPERATGYDWAGNWLQKAGLYY